MMPPLYYYICTFIFGAAVGSFLNVCIYRIPLKQDIVKESSHCMSCGHRLAWYDNIPIIAWIMLKGRCRYCGTRISPQYPAIELLNAVLWVITVVICGISVVSFIKCFIISALVVLSIIDWRTYEIPFGVNLFIFVCGMVVTVCSAAGYGGASDTAGMAAVWSHMAGMLVVSVPLWLLLILSRGRAIGGGDVKLFFAAGLALGTASTIVAFFASFLLAAIIHISRMKLTGAESKLAMGPYISAGICISIWFGTHITNWYMNLML